MRSALVAASVSVLLAALGLVVLLALPDDLLGSEPVVRLSAEHAPTMIDLVGVALLTLGGLGVLVTVVVAAQRTTGTRGALSFAIGYLVLLTCSLVAVLLDAAWYAVPIGATVLWQAGWAIVLMAVHRRRTTRRSPG